MKILLLISFAFCLFGDDKLPKISAEQKISVLNHYTEVLEASNNSKELAIRYKEELAKSQEASTKLQKLIEQIIVDLKLDPKKYTIDKSLEIVPLEQKK